MLISDRKFGKQFPVFQSLRCLSICQILCHITLSYTAVLYTLQSRSVEGKKLTPRLRETMSVLPWLSMNSVYMWYMAENTSVTARVWRTVRLFLAFFTFQQNSSCRPKLMDAMGNEGVIWESPSWMRPIVIHYHTVESSFSSLKTCRSLLVFRQWRCGDLYWQVVIVFRYGLY